AGLRAVQRLPEVDIHHIFEVAALFGLRLRRAAAAEKLREDVAETSSAAGPGFGAPSAATGAGEIIGKIESPEIHSRAARCARSAATRSGKPVLRVKPV